MVLGRKGMTTPVRVQQSIRQLETKGLTHTQIAKELGVSRTTVVKYATRDYSPTPTAGREGSRSLVVDELGYLPIDIDGARLLFQVIADSYEKRSVVFTTNLEFGRWGEVFGDGDMAAAVIDRIVHHGRIVRFRGESYRNSHSLMR